MRTSELPLPDGQTSAISNMATDLPCGTVSDYKRRWLTLVPDDAPAPAGVEIEGADVHAASQRAADVVALPAHTTAAALPPMAAPVDAFVPTLFEVPEGVLALLETANEQRRVLDLLWSAYEMGAIQLPNVLATKLQRACSHWPAALAPLPS